MKYKLRFFVNNGDKHIDCESCFATLSSEHVPKKGQLVYISDDCIDLYVVKTGQIYQVMHYVYCYDNMDTKEYNNGYMNHIQNEGCHSVEVMVKVVDV